MKLHPGHRILAVFDGHDLAVVASRGRHPERGRYGSRRDDERVIPCDLDRRWQPGEQAGAVVRDQRGATVDGASGSGDWTAVRRADALMAEAHAENRGG